MLNLYYKHLLCEFLNIENSCSLTHAVDGELSLNASLIELGGGVKTVNPGGPAVAVIYIFVLSLFSNS